MSSLHGTSMRNLGPLAIFCVALSMFFFSSQSASAGLWKAPWEAAMSGIPSSPPGQPTKQEAKAIALEDSLAAAISEAASPAPDGVTSSVPKLFWGDGDAVTTINNNDTPLHHGSIYTVDPGTAPIARLLFDTDSYFLGDKGELDGQGIPVVTLDTNLVATNLSIGYFWYVKAGHIYLVNTTTLAKTQISTENGLTPANICSLRAIVDWKNPTNSIITYTLAGPDTFCNTGDDINRAVKLNMTATSAPATLNHKFIQTILLDGRYIAVDFSSTPQVQVCNTTLTTCTNIASFTNSAFPIHFNATNVLLNVDGSMLRFNYVANSKLNLYTPPANQKLDDARLDRDGNVYFSTTSTASPFTNTIKKVSPNTGPASTLTLATVTTASALNHLDFSVSPSYVVFSYPNTGDSGAFVRSVLKTPPAGTPAVNTLADSSVNGGVVGSFLFYEDRLGQTIRVALDATAKIVLSGALINGASQGGKGDWYYRFDTTAFRGILTVGSTIKSIAYGDNFSLPGVGVVLGTMPNNLSNAQFMQTGYDMIGTAQRRGTNFSQGRDTLYIKAGTAASFNRLTNNNGSKLVVQSDL